MPDTQLITEAIVAATTEVFTTMLSDEPRAGDAYAERNANGLADGVVSLIGLTGPWLGTGMITCSGGLACRLSATLLLSETTESEPEVNDEVLDSIAEITNMIIGNVKNILEGVAGELSISIPTVVYGKNLTTRSMNDGEWIVVPFDCFGERLEVKLCMVPNSGRPQRPSLTLIQTSGNALTHSR
jgi:chemotaxis protein CheX